VRREIVVSALVLGLCAVACKREARRFEEVAYMSGGAGGTRIDESPSMPLPAQGQSGPYAGNAWAISEGQRLYNQMNCVGCHANGGGGMGPALIDDKWRYGSEASDIFDTIMEGRPNGMPAWRGRLSDQQAWQLAAYVRSMSGMQSGAASGTRQDHMASIPPPSRVSALPPVKEGP